MWHERPVVNGEGSPGEEEQVPNAKKHVTLTNKSYVLAMAIITGIADIKRVWERKDGQNLLHDLRLVSSGRSKEASSNNIQILQEMGLLDRDGIPVPDLGDIVLAAVKGKYPNYRLRERPYEHTPENEAAMARALETCASVMGLKEAANSGAPCSDCHARRARRP
jgi:hypothetical protein